MRNIALIGFMGCGKSAVGRRLASRLGLKHVDTDSEIERVTNKTVEQIFAKDGPFRFRSEEKILLKKLAGKQNLVISTGGGIVLDQENVELLQKDGVLIHLYASSEVIYKRVKGRRNRPLLNRGDLKQRINELLEERIGAYDLADLTIDTDNYNIEEVVKKIINFLQERKYLS